jgi:ribosome-associated protein
VLRAADRRIETLTPTVLEQAEIASLHPMQGSGEPDIGPLVRNVLHSLDDSKAEDIISIDLRGKSTLADVMVIATGRSNVHVGAIADRLLRSCKDAGLAIPHVEGMPHCDWVLIDAHDVIVHIFRPEVRQFYNLEKMWGGDRPAERPGVRRAV